MASAPQTAELKTAVLFGPQPMRKEADVLQEAFQAVPFLSIWTKGSPRIEGRAKQKGRTIPLQHTEAGRIQ